MTSPNALARTLESDAHRLVVFGACDRHNLGDLLFPHIVARMLSAREVRVAGLIERDLRGYGGHRVKAIGSLVGDGGGAPMTLVHAGGELLTCAAWEAAVMLLPPEEASAVVARLDALPAQRLAWATQMLGNAALAPYVIAKRSLPAGSRVVFHAVGGVDLHACDAALRSEVLEAVRTADAIGVRDPRTQAHLHAAGIASTLMPDPVAMVAALFGDAIRQRAAGDELARLRASAYLAVQFSADFGDDATLAAIAAQLDEVALAHGLHVVFFRAGAAPWHDDAGCYRRTAAQMRARVELCESLDVWDLCALIAHSACYLGSSLHGRIVAAAFARPRVNIAHAARCAIAGKHQAYAQCWEPAGMREVVAVRGIAAAVRRAMSVPGATLLHHARDMVMLYQRGLRNLGMQAG